ncbi:MAG: NAD(P)/FAD-dependent oxidoreductase [Hyphomicrobiales bacterium]
MRTFLGVKLGLLPFILLLILLPRLGVTVSAAIALALGLGALVWRLKAGDLKQVELALTGLFALALAGGLAGIGNATAWSAATYATLAATSAFSLIRRKPWTADYSRAAFAAEADTPVFFWVNAILSGLWGAIFAYYAVAVSLQLPGILTAAITVIGVLASVFGPRLLIRRLAPMMIRKPKYDWPAPAVLGRDRSNDVDVAIVGAGIGGLTAAALLAEAGARVLVAESHVVSGGFCHSWLRKERHDGRPLVFRFDAGVHDISGVREGGPVTSVLERVGAEPIDWLRLDQRFHVGGRVIDVPRTAAGYVELLSREFPQSAAGIAALFADIRAIFDGMYAQAPANTGIPGAPANIDDLLAFPKAHPLAVRWMPRPFAELVRSHIADEDCIRLLFGLSGYVTDDPAKLTVAAMVPLFGYVFFGGYYPRGGSGKLADALAGAVIAHGGEVMLKAPVSRILLENGAARGLRLANGREFRAGAVISNADVKKTFRDLVGREHLPDAFAREIDALRPSCSAFAVHLGLREMPDAPPVVHISTGAGHCGAVLTSKVDPSAAPEGYGTMELLRIVSNEEAGSWFAGEDRAAIETTRRGNAYISRKKEEGDRLVATAASVFPGLEEAIVHRTEASPVTFARYELTSAGAIYGTSGLGGFEAKSPVPGLVVAGSATHGAGVEAVLISGAEAAAALVPGLLATRPAAA